MGSDEDLRENDEGMSSQNSDNEQKRKREKKKEKKDKRKNKKNRGSGSSDGSEDQQNIKQKLYEDITNLLNVEQKKGIIPIVFNMN